MAARAPQTAENSFLISRTDLEDRMAVLLGVRAARAAEQLNFGKVSTGAADALDRASEIVHAMTTRNGMDDDLGHMVYEPKRQLIHQADKRTGDETRDDRKNQNGHPHADVGVGNGGTVAGQGERDEDRQRQRQQSPGQQQPVKPRDAPSKPTTER